MSWSIGFDPRWKRDIGYGVSAWCDHPGCGANIDRGLAHVCGNEPYGGEHGCGLYFCDKHHRGEHSTCERCSEGKDPFPPKHEHRDWIRFKLNDESWQEWREQNPSEVATLKEKL